jgi:hypothetical protein
MAGRLGCTTDVEGEVSENSSRIHLGEEEKKNRLQGGEKSFDGRRL